MNNVRIVSKSDFIYSFNFYLICYFWRNALFIFSKIFYIHIPSLLWGIYIELTNSVCPLTYLENWFLNKAELATYSNGFINNYLYPIIYPEGLTAEIQIYFGASLIVINILIYGLILKNLKNEKNFSDHNF